MISQAPSPKLPIPRGRAGPKLLAHILVSKYADHLPLYRQSEIFAREGVELNRTTMADWVGQVSWLLRPLIDKIARHVFASEKIHTDDTPVPVQAPGNGKTKTGRLWVYARDNRNWKGGDPPAAVYYYSPDRKAEHPKRHLRDYAGFLQADGYPGYEQLYTEGRQPGPLIEVACWAHVRRKIFDVWVADKKSVASQGISIIRQLYDAHQRARSSDPNFMGDPWGRVGVVARSFFGWAEDVLSQISAKSSLAEALRYAVARREALMRFTEDRRLEMDNNRAENSLRGIAIGRKNYLFAGSDRGGERAAAIYSLIETAKLNGVNPQIWLADVLERVGDGHPINRLDELLPWNWKELFGKAAMADARKDRASPVGVTEADLTYAAEIKGKADSQPRSVEGLRIGVLDHYSAGRHMGYFGHAAPFVAVRTFTNLNKQPFPTQTDIEGLIEQERIWIKIGEVKTDRQADHGDGGIIGIIANPFKSQGRTGFALSQRSDGAFDMLYKRGLRWDSEDGAVDCSDPDQNCD